MGDGIQGAEIDGLGCGHCDDKASPTWDVADEEVVQDAKLVKIVEYKC